MNPGASNLSGVAEAYRVRGIGGALEPGFRFGIVVVDFITGFTNPDWAPGFNCDAEVEATSQLLAAARRHGVPIFFTTIIFEKARHSTSVWLAKMPAMTCLTPDSPSVLVDSRLAPKGEEPVIAKTAASGFAGTDLGAQLVQHGIDTIVICGATTSGCVRASSRK
jgi:nicotinamidase-related amidase